jgi:nitronate monooxygenase
MRTRLTDLIGIEVPIVQAPMAGCNGADLVVAVAQAGGLGSLPTALFDAAGIGEEMRSIRDRTSAPINLNFFCHTEPEEDAARMERWLGSLAAYYAELGVEPPRTIERGGRSAFDAAMCEIVEELRPEVVSFQFGLPDESLVTRVKAAGAVVFSTATTAAEARWLAERGCDVVVAQGAEAGGHRGTFLGADVSSQVGTMALVPQVVDTVEVPVVAAGGIGDGRGVAAAMVLGADGVQIGTGFLRCPEAMTSALHRAALTAAADDATALTNVFTGRPARGIVNRIVAEMGPMSPDAPAFPLGALAVGPLRAAAETAGISDFSPLWSGQAAALARDIPAGDLVRELITDAVAQLGAVHADT